MYTLIDTMQCFSREKTRLVSVSGFFACFVLVLHVSCVQMVEL